MTGGAARIGRAIAIALAADGWSVALHCNRSRAAAEATVAEIEKSGGRAAVVLADLADPGALAGLVPAAARAIGPLTALVNNASVFERDEIDDLTEESWQRHIDVNLKAPLFLAQAFAAQRPAGRPGNIINLTDQRVFRLTPHFVSYTVSKVGLHALTQTLAMALAPDIRVNAIAPGPTLASTRQSAAQFEKQRRSTPLRRGADPEDIAAGIRYILAAGSMTGQTIALDGGQHLPWPPPNGQEAHDE
ncbi:SDR family oxidoreductase [Oceanibacterium hippocampi]|uniref:SDR family oxidoreductase n=1 Tax=Oceanibacterium hippocampi TaxID=745714 RepID=UPI001C38ADCB